MTSLGKNAGLGSDIAGLRERVYRDRQDAAVICNDAASIQLDTRLRRLARVAPQASRAHILNEILDAAIAISASHYANLQLFDPRAGGLKIEAHRGFKRPFLD